MRTAKAVLVAGEQHLFPVANRPILFHHLEGLRRAGLLEATILVERRAREPIARAVGDGADWNLSVRVDGAPAGESLTAAIATCERFGAGEPLLVQHADALLHGRLTRHIAAFDDDRLDALALRLEDDPDGTPPGYLLSPRAQSLLVGGPAANPIGAVQASGGRVRVASVAGSKPCHGDLESLLDCNRHVLQGLDAASDLALGEDCRVQGPVVVHPSATVQRSTLRGPLVIGPNATVADAYIGPYTSIGANARIEGAEVEHAIVLTGAQVMFVGTRIESSVIGAGARVARGFTRPSSLRMWIGDGAEVLLS